MYGAGFVPLRCYIFIEHDLYYIAFQLMLLFQFCTVVSVRLLDEAKGFIN